MTVDAERPRLRVLDLFCGLKGWSQPFVERGHEVVTVDIEARFNPTIVVDVMNLHPQDVEPIDVLLASPPCEGFSVMQIGKNWTREHEPKTDKAKLSQALVSRTLDMVLWLRPKFWVIENPRAKLRKLPMMQHYERHTVTYCKYGETRMKPTDLWGRFPPSLTLHPPCVNGDSCHVRAPRGSRTGTQGMDRAESARIPYALALDVCIACERDANAK